MSNLSAKFSALETALTGKLDTIIGKLDDLLAIPEGSNDDVVAAIGRIISRLDTAQAMGGSRNVLLSDIRDAIGAITTYPPNYTVRRLLALLQTSIDAIPADYAGNEPPGNTYACGPWTRQIAWTLVGSGLTFTTPGIPGGYAVDVYVPVFPAISSPIPLIVQDTSLGFQMIRAESGSCNVCFGCNRTGDDNISTPARHLIWKTFLSNAYPEIGIPSWVPWDETNFIFPIDTATTYTEKLGGGSGAIGLGDHVTALIRVQNAGTPPPTALNYFISSTGGGS
jgi:hypothetical protein